MVLQLLLVILFRLCEAMVWHMMTLCTESSSHILVDCVYVDVGLELWGW